MPPHAPADPSSLPPADAPPSLQSLAEQVQAVQATQGGQKGGALLGASTSELPVACTTIPQPLAQSTSTEEQARPLRRGFFDVKPKKRSAVSRPKV